MDTVTGHLDTPDQPILLELEARSVEESDAIAAQAQSGPQPPLRSADARHWAEADADALSQLTHASRQAALEVIARNMMASSTYAEQISLVAPQYTSSAQPIALAQQVAHVIATHLPMSPDLLPDHATRWPAQVTDYFRAPGQRPDVQQHVERMLKGISTESASAFQARVTSMLAPAPAEQHELAATSGLRVHTAWDLTYEEQVRQVARVVSANANLLPWKVDANLRREPAAVRALLADPAQMRVLEKDVAALVAVPTERVSQVRAMIEQASQPASARVPRPHDGIPRPVMQEDLARSEDALQLVANFIASAQNLTKEAVYTNARYAPPALQAILGNSRHMQELDQALNARLAFIPAGRIADVQATIATALGRADAAQRVHAAQAMAIPADAPSRSPSPSDRPAPETVQRAIDFLATAATLYSDKIPERLASAPADVRALLADADRMKELDGAINMRLAHVLPDRLAGAHAAIAVALQRPDADQRLKAAQALRAERAEPERSPAPTASPATPDLTELQALQRSFKQHIAAAATSATNQPSIKDLYDRIAARHRLYDNLAIATRMERGQEIMGGAQPHALRGVVSSSLAGQWAKLDAADLQGMLRAAGDKFEHLAAVRSAIGLMNGTAERDSVYRSNVMRVAPTMHADVEAARLHIESHAVAAFIRDNHTNPAWKIQSNLERAAPALQRILRDNKRMGELDAAMQEQLPLLDQQHIHAVRAVIAGDLQRADLPERPAVVSPRREQSTAPQAHPDHAKATPPRAAMQQAAPPATEATAPARMPTAQSTRNGIVSASGAPADHAPVVKKLLEDMSYKVRGDGSVLYQVQGKEAFIDHGDQLLMVSGAEKEERAILGALLLAKEKYGGAFELTGSEAFKRAAIDILVKYELDVRLKNPEQDLLRRETSSKQPQKQFVSATREHPVAPIDMATLASPMAASAPRAVEASADPSQPPSKQRFHQPNGMPAPTECRHASTQHPDGQAETVPQTLPATKSPAPSNTDPVDMPPLAEPSSGQAVSATVPVDPLTGTLLRHGAAPYGNTLRNDASYFVELKNSDGRIHTQWGQELGAALMLADARIGDDISLKRLGTSNVVKKVPKWDEHGNFLEQHLISGRVNHWKAEIRQRQADMHAAALGDHEPEQVPPAAQLTGTLLRHGTAHYLNTLQNHVSYFVELLNHKGDVHTQWGRQLADVLHTTKAGIGDRISLKWLGTTDTTQQNPVLDGQGNIERPQPGSSQHHAWTAQILHRRPHSPAANRDLADNGQPKAPLADTTDNLLQGRLLAHGAAPLKNARDGKQSYFVQVQKPDGESRTFWGLDLERALAKSGAQNGDAIVLQNLGRKPVQVEAPTRDSAGNVIGMGTAISHRNAWEISTSRPVARPTDAVSIAEASPALQATSVAVREAAWWQRQIPFLRTCLEQTPALEGKIEELGPRPDSRDVAWIDKHGDRRVIANDISYGALCDRMPSLKECHQTALALEGGTLDGQTQATALKLIRASDNYLQGIAQVGGKVRHVVALLPVTRSDAPRSEDTPIPLMAAISAPDGFAWERIGQLRVEQSAPGGPESRQAATMHFDVGRESIRVQVHAKPGDALHQRLGLAPVSEHRLDNKEPTGPRQPARADHTANTAHRPKKPDTPTYA